VEQPTPFGSDLQNKHLMTITSYHTYTTLWHLSACNTLWYLLVKKNFREAKKNIDLPMPKQDGFAFFFRLFPARLWDTFFS